MIILKRKKTQSIKNMQVCAHSRILHQFSTINNDTCTFMHWQLSWQKDNLNIRD